MGDAISKFNIKMPSKKNILTRIAQLNVDIKRLMEDVYEKFPENELIRILKRRGQWNEHKTKFTIYSGDYILLVQELDEMLMRRDDVKGDKD